jgi:hypothetical protein
VENPAGVSQGVERASVDGKILTERPLYVHLTDGGGTHRVQIRLGPIHAFT